MIKSCVNIFMIPVLLAGAIRLAGQNIEFTRDFQYPQTPTFVDQTSQENQSSGKIDTVWSMRKQERMSQPTADRNRFGCVKMVCVPPGALEPDRNYGFGLISYLGAKYIRGTFSFTGPADALICITGFAWGTENNNGNFIPLLISLDYQAVKQPSYEFTWYQPTGYQIDHNNVLPINDQVVLNYNFKVPAQSKVDWANSPGFHRFSAAGGAWGKVPPIVKNSIFTWDYAGLGVFSSQISRSYRVKGRIALPGNCIATGFAVSPTDGTIFLALSDGRIIACTLNGSILWEAEGQPPLIVYKNHLLAISPDYQNLQSINTDSGDVEFDHDLPSYLPRNENCMATFSTEAGDFLLLSIPAQSRIICYRLANM